MKKVILVFLSCICLLYLFTACSKNSVQSFPSIDTQEVDKLLVHINAGTATGMEYTVSRNDEEITLNTIMNIFFNDQIEYSPCKSGYGENLYDFSVTFYNSSGDEILKLFCCDQNTVRYNKQFYYSSIILDHEPIFETLSEKVKQKLAY